MTPIFYRCGLGFVTCFHSDNGKIVWFNCNSFANSKAMYKNWAARRLKEELEKVKGRNNGKSI